MLPVKLFLNYLSIFIIGLFAIPTASTLITWNTLPGQKLYPIKRNLETLALKIIGSNFKAQTGLRTKLVDRRFSENSTLLAQASTKGLPELTAEIQSLKDILLAAENSQECQNAAQELRNKLEEYNSKLEQKKQTVTVTQSQEQPTINPSIKGEPAETLPPTPPPPSSATQEINQTQQELEEVIQELEQITDNSSPTPQPKHEENQKGKDKEKKSPKNKNNNEKLPH